MEQTQKEGSTLSERDDLHQVQSLFGVKPICFYSKFVEGLSKSETVNNAISTWCSKETIIPVDIFTESQRLIYNKIKKALWSSTHTQILFCTLANAGSGKSFLLRGVSQLLSRLNKNFEVLAFSGIAASNCDGVTCHSFLRINYLQPGGYEYLVKQPVSKRFREKVKNLEFLLIDECGFINPQLLYYIHDRLCKARKSQLPFAGIHTVLCGDFSQIGAVCGPQLYESPNHLNGIAKKGCDLFRKFSIFNLVQKVRQSSDLQFQTILDNIRYRQVSLADYSLLRSRCVSELDDCELEGFKDAISIFPFNSQVDDWNNKEVLSLGETVFTFIPEVGKKFPAVEESLNICVAKRAKVVLCKNIKRSTSEVETHGS